ncbi:hypothetical protein SAMN05660742_1176 [Propionispira arboris]|uniref:Uncharacterized protein n=1 Tax=Propionispira arboris TaxID=84035 RepID=A0A1H7BM31_9FIRM|nr:hypothetical protein [Propionispira arboris]SEJ78518.1 hypothetical protein SAMN05660742_1176 [Propionispira arboris]
MEKDEDKLVDKFLNITTAQKWITGMYPMLAFLEVFVCLTYISINLAISVPCAVVIFFSIVIWGEIIKENNKFLFLYYGMENSLLSLCCMLIVLAISHLDFFYGIIAFIAMLLPSIPCNIYFAKRQARKMLSGQDSMDDMKLKPFVKIACSLGVLIGIIEMRILSADGKTLVGVVCFGIMFYMFQGFAISEFHKEIIRRRYNININNLLKQQSIKPARKR